MRSSMAPRNFAILHFPLDSYSGRMVAWKTSAPLTQCCKPPEARTVYYCVADEQAVTCPQCRDYRRLLVLFVLVRGVEVMVRQSEKIDFCHDAVLNMRPLAALNEVVARCLSLRREQYGFAARTNTK